MKRWANREYDVPGLVIGKRCTRLSRLAIPCGAAWDGDNGMACGLIRERALTDSKATFKLYGVEDPCES